MQIGKVAVKCISVLLTLTFITGQVLAGQIAPKVSSDKLSLSSVFDPQTNPDRTADFADKIKPGAIANGRFLTENAQGKLPTTLTGDVAPRLALNESEVTKLREAAKLAMALSIGYSNPKYQKIVDIAKRNLIDFNHRLVDKTYLYSLLVDGPEQYSAGFGFVQGFTGLTKELVDTLSPKLLAQYLWHELAPESEIILIEMRDERSPYISHKAPPEGQIVTSEMLDERSAHRAAYQEIQAEIFGKEDVIALKNEIRA
ncbi:MAG: hypothetical protein V1682_00705, partial [Candidatus Omnitrophota bacterium]